jgi:hypothetical protein
MATGILWIQVAWTHTHHAAHTMSCSAYLSKDELGAEAESPDINRHNDEEHNVNSNNDCNNNEQNPILQRL